MTQKPVHEAGCPSQRPLEHWESLGINSRGPCTCSASKPGAGGSAVCEACNGTGLERIQGHPDHTFYCEKCNGKGKIKDTTPGLADASPYPNEKTAIEALFVIREAVPCEFERALECCDIVEREIKALQSQLREAREEVARADAQRIQADAQWAAIDNDKSARLIAAIQRAEQAERELKDARLQVMEWRRLLEKAEGKVKELTAQVAHLEDRLDCAGEILAGEDI